MKASYLLLPSLVAVLSTPVFAEYRCNAPQFPHERVACQEAKKSPDALRWYISRTQAMHNLRFSDYMSASDLDNYYARIQAAEAKKPAEERRDVAVVEK